MKSCNADAMYYSPEDFARFQAKGLYVDLNKIIPILDKTYAIAKTADMGEVLCMKLLAMHGLAEDVRDTLNGIIHGQ